MDITSEKLKDFNGKDGKPVYISVLGQVHDCTSSEHIKAETGYGKLWGGRDATYSLAKGSLKPEDAHRLDFTDADFTHNEKRSLRLYEQHFKSKYPIVGRLVEYKNQTDNLPPLSELPEKIEPREVPELQKRKFRRLTVGESNKVCHAAGFHDIDESCLIGDLSEAMIDMGREKLEEVATRVDVHFRDVKSWDDDILGVTIVETALEFKGQRSLHNGADVLLRGLKHDKEELNWRVGKITEHSKEKNLYAVKLEDSNADPQFYKPENIALL